MRFGRGSGGKRAVAAQVSQSVLRDPGNSGNAASMEDAGFPMRRERT